MFRRKLGLEAVDAHFTVLAACHKTAIAQTNAGDRAGMSSKGAFTFTSPRVPDLDHSIFCTGYNAQRISRQCPDTFQVPEKGS